ncbi:hypothetical protein [Lacticigenium naphthae]|uniref:hypothetical protein n=1 Tax=Lacticigenium naphthae TaxID=515351 RepID=UPI0004298C89|nr:hypothetical protein [Lacticigenium naphthae]
MGLEKTASIPGESKQYRVHPEVKKYTLRDNGFQESKSGKYHLTRTLSVNPMDKKAPLLKINIGSDLTTLKISITTQNGLQSLILPNKENFKEAYGIAQSVLYQLVEGKALSTVE